MLMPTRDVCEPSTSMKGFEIIVHAHLRDVDGGDGEHARRHHRGQVVQLCPPEQQLQYELKLFNLCCRCCVLRGCLYNSWDCSACGLVVQLHTPK